MLRTKQVSCSFQDDTGAILDAVSRNVDLSTWNYTAPQRYRSVYFDTSDQRLRRLGLSLRIAGRIGDLGGSTAKRFDHASWPCITRRKFSERSRVTTEALIREGATAIPPSLLRVLGLDDISEISAVKCLSQIREKWSIWLNSDCLLLVGNDLIYENDRADTEKDFKVVTIELRVTGHVRQHAMVQRKFQEWIRPLAFRFHHNVILDKQQL